MSILLIDPSAWTVQLRDWIRLHLPKSFLHVSFWIWGTDVLCDTQLNVFENHTSTAVRSRSLVPHVFKFVCEQPRSVGADQLDKIHKPCTIIHCNVVFASRLDLISLINLSVLLFAGIVFWLTQWAMLQHFPNNSEFILFLKIWMKICFFGCNFVSKRAHSSVKHSPLILFRLTRKKVFVNQMQIKILFGGPANI